MRILISSPLHFNFCLSSIPSHVRSALLLHTAYQAYSRLLIYLYNTATRVQCFHLEHNYVCLKPLIDYTPEIGHILRSGLSGGGVFEERILGVGSDGMERVGFEIGVGDDQRMSHSLKFQRVLPLVLGKGGAFSLPNQPSV